MGEIPEYHNGERKEEMSDFEFAKSVVLDAGEFFRDNIGKDFETEWKEDNTPVTPIDKMINKMVIDRIKERFPHDRIYGEEASAEADGEAEYTWVLDPIDGTQSLDFVPTATICLSRLDRDGNPVFSLAYNPIEHNPFPAELFTAKRGEGAFLNDEPIYVSEKTGVRSSYIFLGSGMQFKDVASNGTVYDRLESQGGKIFNTRSLAFGCLMVAAGRAEGALIACETPFEAATVKLIVEGAGGKVTDLHGNDPGRLDGELSGGMLVSNGHLHDALVDALKAA